MCGQSMGPSCSICALDEPQRQLKLALALYNVQGWFGVHTTCGAQARQAPGSGMHSQSMGPMQASCGSSVQGQSYASAACSTCPHKPCAVRAPD